MKGTNTYWTDLNSAIATLWSGLRTSIKHLFDARSRRTPEGITDSRYFDQSEGRVTLNYPNETLPVPVAGRYKLHNEIDDCIVCDKCAKVCPVNCIDIEPIRSAEPFGETSDGTPKRIYAAKFDIDMAKCCFCGLCTTVCPTECLTMKPDYDYSVFDISEHDFEFADMPEKMITQKRSEWEEFQKAKVGAPPSKPGKTDVAKTRTTPKINPLPSIKKSMKPRVKPNIKPKPPEKGEGK